MNRLCWIVIALFLFPVNMYLSGEDHTVKKSEGNFVSEYTIGRIGFLHSFVKDELGADEEVSIGIESYSDAFYKLCSSDGESIVKGGLLSRGLNIVGFPVELITGKNKGVFIIYLKEGDNISKRQIVLIPNRYETIETDPGMDKDGSVSDRYRHEITVNGEDNRFNDYASRIMMDSVTGDYPGLNQGVPILPILYLFISKIVRSIKKKKRGLVSLYSETELYIKHKKHKNKLILLNLRILTSEI